MDRAHEGRHSSENHKPTVVHSAEHDVAADARDGAQQELGGSPEPHQSKLISIYSHPWTQILLISFICFCLPGVRPPLALTVMPVRRTT